MMTQTYRAILLTAVAAFAICAARDASAESEAITAAKQRAAERRAAFENRRKGAQTQPTATLDASGDYKAGQKLEVREGDVWSAATLVKQEGKKFQIRYDDGSEEWVTSDRLRAVAATVKDAPADVKADDNKPATTQKTRKETFANGAKVEAKDFTTWKPATVKNHEGDLYLVVFEGWESETFWKWLHVSAVRSVGSDKDFDGVAKSVSVAGLGVAKAKEKAKIELAGAGKQAEGGGASGVKKDPWAPEPYDKPITPAKRDGVVELAGGAGPKSLAQLDALPTTRKIAERGYVLRGAQHPWLPASMLFAGTRGIMVYKHETAREHTGKIEILDLVGGRDLALIDFDPLSWPIALSPAGTRIAGRSDGFGSNNKNRLDLFDLKGAGPTLKHVISFEPYEKQIARDIGWAAFVDDDHLITCSTGGELVLWDAPKATAVWRMNLARRSDPALSPGGKQLAIVKGESLLILDSLKGNVLCSLPAPHTTNELTFTPDGKRLVATGGGIVCFWDLATGEFSGDIALASKTAGITPTADSRFVLAGGKDLLDLDKKLVVWEYAGGASTSPAGLGGKSFNIVRTNDRRVVLVAAALPHEAARKSANSILPGKGLALQPGGSVSVNIAAEGTPELQQRITAALTEQLKRNGVTVDPNSPVKLFARTESGKTNSQTYQVRKFGDPNVRTETVSSTEKITRVGFEYNGKVLWDTSSVTGGYLPMMVTTQGGKTIGETLAEQGKHSSSWLETALLPTYVPMVSDKPWAGGSHWTMKGVLDDRTPDLPPAGFAPVKRAASAPAAKGDGLD